MLTTSELGNSAATAESSPIGTPCPLCQMQLDIYQDNAQEQHNSKARLPVLHLSQLVGLALGLPAKQLGLDYNVIDATKLG